MPSTIDEVSFLREIFQRLRDDPLKPGNALYEPIYEAWGPRDPVHLMFRQIEFSEVDSIQMFSGFRGSGKTTELFRLRKLLEERGYVVMYADALVYVSPSDPIGVADFLMVLAGAFGEALQAQFGAESLRESGWDRIKNFVTRTAVKVQEASVALKVSSPAKDVLGGLEAGVDLKTAIRTTPTFKQLLQRVLENSIGELKQEVDRFFEEGLKVIRAQRGERVGVVFMFDQLEQLQGRLGQEQDVIASLERLLSAQVELLKIPYVHAVYTVPPWLKFILLAAQVPITILPCIPLWENDEPRSKREENYAAIRSIVARRFELGFDRVFGSLTDGKFPLVDRIIGASGGQFRDLLRLCRDAVLGSLALPISEDAVEAAINSLRADFMPIAIDEAKWLALIAKTRSSALPDTKPESVDRLTRFLNVHYVLYFTNGGKEREWYDVHPVIRDEIDKVLRIQEETRGQ